MRNGFKTISAPQYLVERAICDRANAYWKANASFGRGGASSMSAEMAAHPDYSACTNEMRGRVAQYETLRDLPETIVGYMHLPRESREATNFVACRKWQVTTWTGDVLGFAYETGTWSTPQSHVGSKMRQFKATIGGREYTGRGYGEGMSIALRETAASKRQRLPLAA